ncbi:unnamed protein product [Clavelina lepadiformis]|uniref:Uncharacterized protein n=1 Tax=Clavelina lepadiformis TaxID=159417 RepID=A0ABP0EYC6_CLALP
MIHHEQLATMNKADKICGQSCDLFMGVETGLRKIETDCKRILGNFRRLAKERRAIVSISMMTIFDGQQQPTHADARKHLYVHSHRDRFAPPSKVAENIITATRRKSVEIFREDSKNDTTDIALRKHHNACTLPGTLV